MAHQQGTESPPLSSTTSEDDFWVNLDHLPVLARTAKHRERNSLGETGTKERTVEGKELIQMEKSIRILRAAKKVEVLNASLQAKTQMKSLRAEYEAEISELQGNYDDIKAILYRKDKEIERIGRMMYDQEITLTALRLNAMGGHHYRRPGKAADVREVEDLRSECGRLKGQIDTLQSLCHLYQEESNRAKAGLEDAKVTIKHQSIECERLVKSLEMRTDTREKQLIEEKDNCLKAYFPVSFVAYKDQVEQELQLRDLVSDRQNKYIQSLQDELKSAKMVLCSPRLRHKMLTRVKDLEETMRSEGGRDSRTPKGRGNRKGEWRGSSPKSVSPPPFDLRTAKGSVQLPSLSIPAGAQALPSPDNSNVRSNMLQ